MMLDITMKVIGVLIALIMLSGLFICWMMSLAVVDYVFDTDIKNWLCTHLPKWSMMRKVRDHIEEKVQVIDEKCREDDERVELAAPLGLYSIFDSSITSVTENYDENSIKVTTASGTVYIVVKERPLPKDILIEKDNEPLRENTN